MDERDRKIGLLEATIEEQLKERSAVYGELAHLRRILRRIVDCEKCDNCIPHVEELDTISKAGSAETGGEKAAPRPKPGTAEYYARQTGEVLASGSYSTRAFEIALEIRREPTFPRSSQNQTVSSGVEGAHEGITADKSALAESSLSQKCHACRPTGQCDACKQAAYDSMSASLSSPPPISAREFRQKHYVLPSSLDTYLKAEDFAEAYANFRQSPSPMNRGAESAHSGKQNTADKSELLPTQLPKEK